MQSIVINATIQSYSKNIESQNRYSIIYIRLLKNAQKIRIFLYFCLIFCFLYVNKNECINIFRQVYKNQMIKGQINQNTRYNSRPESFNVEDIEQTDRPDHNRPSVKSNKPQKPSQKVGSKPSINQQNQPNAGNQSVPPPNSQHLPAKILLIQALDAQNKCLMTQQSQLHSHLQQVKQSTGQLLSQNQMLRQAHRQRTQDLPKIISTLSLNTSQNMADHQHQSFLLKQFNHALLKQINHLDKQKYQLEDRIARGQQVVLRIDGQRIALQQEELNQLRARLGGNQAQFCKRDIKNGEKELTDTVTYNNNLYAQINTLMGQKTQLISQIQVTLAQITPQQQQDLQKLQLNYRLQTVHKEIRQYKEERARDRNDLEKLQTQLQNQTQKHEKTLNQLNQQIRTNYLLQRQYQQQESTIDGLRKAVTQAQLHQSKAKQEKDTLQDKKKSLQKQIQAKNRGLRQLNASKWTQKETQMKKTQKDVDHIKGTIQANRKNAQVEVKKYKTQLKATTKSIQQMQFMHSGLQQQIEAYKKALQELHNPTSEIARLQRQIQQAGRKESKKSQINIFK